METKKAIKVSPKKKKASKKDVDSQRLSKSLALLGLAIGAVLFSAFLSETSNNNSVSKKRTKK